jgi:hypothetical protein
MTHHSTDNESSHLIKVQRQNVLNNSFALKQAQDQLGLGGLLFEGDYVFAKRQLVRLFEVSDATIERYLEKHDNELKYNGYQVLKGKKLKEFKDLFAVSLMDEGDKFPPALGVFSFRAVLNFAMLLEESEKAKEIRSRILDITLSVIKTRAGGDTKLINQRDTNFLPAVVKEDNYRKKFTQALKDYLNMDSGKYALYTNKIYRATFLEDAAEYRKILRLEEKKELRNTLYSEVLNAIAAFENGLAVQMQQFYQDKQRQLEPFELDEMIDQAQKNPFLQPHLQDARIKMSSRDLGLRDTLHQKLSPYIEPMSDEEYEKFLGSASKSLEEQLKNPDVLDVLKRLKDK